MRTEAKREDIPQIPLQWVRGDLADSGNLCCNWCCVLFEAPGGKSFLGVLLEVHTKWREEPRKSGFN